MTTIQIPSFHVELFDMSMDLACFLRKTERLTDIEGLMKRLDHALKESDPKHPIPQYIFREDNCLVLSFDASWYAFLDNTRAYNQPEVRSYVPANPLLNHVLDAMKNLQRPTAGGRVFLHEEGALGANEKVLVRWKLESPSKYLFRRKL